jgi:hypothetical protein
MDTTEALLKGILATVARTAFPPETLYKIVAPTAGSERQISAYNLCDGKTPQGAIAKKVKLDTGNFSRSVTRWIEAGVVIRVGADQFPLHVYPLTKPPAPNGRKGIQDNER